MLLSELSQVQNMGVEVLAEVIRRSKFIQLAQFREEGTDFLHTPLEGRTQPAFRAKNAGYTAEDDNPSPTAAALAFLGKEAIIDRSYKIDAEKGLVNLDHYMRGLLMQRAKAFGEGLEKQIFAADGTGNSTEGFGTLIDGASNVPGYNSTMTIEASATKLDLSDEANWKTFMEVIDEALYAVPDANVLAFNRSLASRMNSIARKYHALDWEINEFGRRVPLFNGVPMVALADGAIASTEPSGGGSPTNDTTSLYVMRKAEWNGVAFASNNGFEYHDFDHLEDKVASKARMELRYKPVIDSADAIRRVNHIQLA